MRPWCAASHLIGRSRLINTQLRVQFPSREQNSILTALCIYAILFFSFFTRIYFPASGQAVVTGFVPSAPRFLPFNFYCAHRVQQSHCSSIFDRVLLTHDLALFASQFVHKKNFPQIYSSMHSGEFELTKLAYTRLQDTLIRHRGDRLLSGRRFFQAAFFLGKPSPDAQRKRVLLCIGTYHGMILFTR